MIDWLAHWLGLDNGSGHIYLFWSGVFGDLTIFAAALALMRRFNCEVKGCWRIGRHYTLGNHHVCAVHHPDGVPTHAHVLKLHYRNKQKDG